MSQRKHIRVHCYGPIAVSKDYESSWEDIWLRWKDRPGHARKAMVTICGRANLENDIDIQRECLADATRDKKDYAHEFSAELATLRGVLDKLTTPESIAVYPREAEDNCPDLYCGREMLTRADAERVMAWWLEKKHGVRNVKFCWRRPRYMVVSI
jgi:hypothetical protein